MPGSRVCTGLSPEETHDWHRWPGIQGPQCREPPVPLKAASAGRVGPALPLEAPEPWPACWGAAEVHREGLGWTQLPPGVDPALGRQGDQSSHWGQTVECTEPSPEAWLTNVAAEARLQSARCGPPGAFPCTDGETEARGGGSYPACRGTCCHPSSRWGPRHPCLFPLLSGTTNHSLAHPIISQTQSRGGGAPEQPPAVGAVGLLWEGGDRPRATKSVHACHQCGRGSRPSGNNKWLSLWSPNL